MKSCILSLFFSLGAAATAAAADVVPGSFIVTLKPGTSATAHHRAVRSILRKRDSTVQSYAIGDSFSAYSATSLTDAEAASLASRDDVLTVEPDYIFTINDFNKTEPDIAPRDLTTQSPAGSWGLADASHRAAGATEYVYDSTSGEGQTAYVVDTGIRLSHQEFEGRARFGYSSVSRSTTYEDDDEGHGTHVAGTVAGKTYGMAKKAQLVAVKSFGTDGTGKASWVLDALQWTVNDIVARNAKNTSVMNLSISGAGTALDEAVRAAWNLGIVSVTAAGNEDQAAVNFSPGRIAETITVGMTRQDRKRSAGFPDVFGSNWGPELDVFAPGQDTVSASWRSDTASRSATGTSMATPLVAGLVCYLRALEGGLESPEAVKSRIIELSLKDVVTDLRGSPNRLVYNGSGK